MLLSKGTAMKIDHQSNQLAAMPQAAMETPEQASERVLALRIWQLRGNPSFRELGRRPVPPISGSGVQRFLKARHISFERHADFVGLGVPVELLPPARLVLPGRRPGQPEQEA